MQNLSNKLVLTGKRAYLSGAIEFGEKIDWRDEPTKILTEEFNIDLFDPFKDPKQQWVSTLHEARDKKDFETMASIASSFVRKDLCMVDRSDFLIANLPFGIPTTGTHHEIINSVNAKKPTLLVCPQGIEKLPLWYYGFVSIDFMFGSWEELYEYLREVNEGLHKDNKRWHFVYGLL